MEEALSSLIPSLVGEGVFGSSEYLGHKRDENTEKGAQFASTISFITLRLKRTSGTEEVPLVIKAQTGYKWMKDILDVKGMFQNEFSMYRHILPALGVNQNRYPKFYYGFVDVEGLSEDVIILGNMKDYKKSEASIFLDYDHMSLAVKTIASFHSFSYICKHESLEGFNELRKKLKWVRYEKTAEGAIVSLKRGADSFSEKHGSNEVTREFLEVLKGGFYLKKLSQPEEPLFGVIHHGDYCNNNIIYKYDDSGSPTECAFFDFQFSYYGTPAIDLAFYLYMHTTSETREKHWDDLLRLYWETLRGRVPRDVLIPSYEEFLEHFSSRAAYGYAISSFFIPLILDHNDADDFGSLTREERIEVEKKRGGEEAENVIRDVYTHAFHRKYIHAFVDFMKYKTMEV